MRTDTALIKHLALGAADHSVEAASIYNRLPLFLMPEESDEIMRYEQALLDAAPDTLQLPFEDFLLDFPFGTKPLLEKIPANNTDRGRLWVRVRRVSSVKKDAATQLSMAHLEKVKDPEKWMLIEGWEEKTLNGGLHISPDFSLIPLQKPDFGRFEHYWHAYASGACWDRLFGFWCNIKGCEKSDGMFCAPSEMIHATTARLVVLALIYLSEGLGGMTTEVSWQPGPRSREEKSERLKPWTVPRRSTYIIIDPTRAGEYGHPSGTRPGTQGSHASPVPHSRRGHWRRLSPDRKTWVRPTWVGATEWVSEGRSYKICIGGRK